MKTVLRVQGDPKAQPRPMPTVQFTTAGVSKAIAVIRNGAPRSKCMDALRGACFGKPIPRSAAKEWRKQIAEELALKRRHCIPKGVPVAVRIRIWMKRPQDHTGTGKNAGILKDWAPAVPTVVNGDFDNLAKAITDELNGVLYADDSQIVECLIQKRYADPGKLPGAHIEVEPWSDSASQAEESAA